MTLSREVHLENLGFPPHCPIQPTNVFPTSSHCLTSLEGTPVTLPGQIGELRRPPPTAILPHLHHQHRVSCYRSPPPLSEAPLPPSKCTQQVAPAGRPQPHLCPPLHLRRSLPSLQLRPGRPNLPLRFWGWPRDARLGFPRCREETLEKLLPMASAPQGCSGGGQARLGRSGGKVCKCVRARVRAAGGGLWRGCGRGRAVR